MKSFPQQKQHYASKNGIANGYNKLANGTISNNENGIKNGASENGQSYLRNRQAVVNKCNLPKI